MLLGGNTGCLDCTGYQCFGFCFSVTTDEAELTKILYRTDSRSWVHILWSLIIIYLLEFNRMLQSH